MDSKTAVYGTAARSLASRFQRLDDTRFSGYAFRPDAPYMHFVIEILLDGEPIGLIRAEQWSDELHQKGEAAPDHGFVFSARKSQLVGHRYIEARIANLALPVGSPIDLALQAYSPPSSTSPGTVEWLGGLRLCGSLTRTDPDVTRRVEVHHNGIVIAEAGTRLWMPQPETAAVADAARFDLHLPSVLADGNAHTLKVIDDSGRELDGSPVTIQAFNDGLRRHVEGSPALASDKARAAWFDRFLPMSLPFEDYLSWQERYRPALLTPARQPPVRVVTVGTADVEQIVERLSHQTCTNWSAVPLQCADGTSFGWKTLLDSVSADASEHTIAVFTKASATLRDDAIARLVEPLLADATLLASYGDIEVASDDGQIEPLFFGAFDYERMLETGYAANLFALRINAIKAPTKERAGNLVRLFLSILDGHDDLRGQSVIHVPGILATLPRKDAHFSSAELKQATLAHLRTRDISATARDSSANIHVRRGFDKSELVSIIIPTRDRVDLLAPCIESITRLTKAARYEIVIVDNGSATEECRRFLADWQRAGNRVVDAPGPFNYSRLNNAGVAAARGSLVCLLNNDTEIAEPDWLAELMSRISDPTVGAVSPKLVWPNRMVQSGGIVLGPNFAASDAFNDCMEYDAGYAGLLQTAHEATAVSAACMLVRRNDYLAVSGFDELAFPVLFNDVDFCLRLRALGKRNIITPHTTVLHHESATRRYDQSYAHTSRFRRELNRLRARWGEVLANDPLYSPFLNLDPYPYSALAWPPRPHAPRINSVRRSTVS